jgi:hemolysin activation/secretion protein
VRTPRLICLAVALVSASAPLVAQVPPGATPGGALPRVESAVRPAEKKGELLDIPRVADRPSVAGAGPRILVKSFRLQGATDYPERDVTVAKAAALLNGTLTTQPAEGFTLDQLQEAANKVSAYYREAGYILAQAFVPAQQVKNGEVVVQVLEGRLGSITVEGNKGYSARTLERPFKLLVGEPLEKESIESALLTVTNYPGVTAFGILGAGREVGTTNLTLRIQDEDAFRAETAVDNYGTRFAGEYRGQVSLTFNDPLGFADRLRLTGLYARNTSGGSSHGAYGGLDYEIPLFSPNDSLRFLHLTNTYDVSAATEALIGADSEGETRVNEVAYRHDFTRTRLGAASIGLAVNTKSASFESASVIRYKDKLATARLDTQWERADLRFRGVNRIAFAYTRGFNGLFDSMDSYDPSGSYDASRASRAGASGRFEKIAVQLQRVQRISQFTSLVARVEGQYTDDPLVSLEQFSMGGPDSVRAYSTSELLAERGGVASLELIVGAPGFSSVPAFASHTWGQVLQFSLFADYAKGKLNEPVAFSDSRDNELSGAGVSTQLSVPGHVFARLDVATPLSSRDPGNGRDPQYFFRFGMTF